jgi:hypothetical protein
MIPERTIGIRGQPPAQVTLKEDRILPSACLQNVGVPKQTFFRGSISRPVLSPVNASAGPSRGPPHDSEPVRFATPSLCDSFIHYALPLTRRFRKPEANLSLGEKGVKSTGSGPSLKQVEFLGAPVLVDIAGA